MKLKQIFFPDTSSFVEEFLKVVKGKTYLPKGLMGPSINNKGNKPSTVTVPFSAPPLPPPLTGGAVPTTQLVISSPLCLPPSEPSHPPPALPVTLPPQPPPPPSLTDPPTPLPTTGAPSITIKKEEVRGRKEASIHLLQCLLLY